MLPSTFATHLVLPTLLNSLTLTTMSTSAPSIIPLVIQLGTYVSSDEYKTLVVEPVVKLFANPDRGTRMALLDALPEFADKLDKQTVSEKVWPHLVSLAWSMYRRSKINIWGPSKLASQTRSR
jgi:SCY1-like protein 1